MVTGLSVILSFGIHHQALQDGLVGLILSLALLRRATILMDFLFLEYSYFIIIIISSITVVVVFKGAT